MAITRRFLENFTFASLIAPVTSNEFRNKFWEQKPLEVHRHQPDYYRDRHTLRDFDAAISSNPKYVKSTDARTKGTTYHETTEAGFEAMIADMREGGTLVLDQAQCVDSTLWRLCRLLEAETGHRFQANLYLTPPNGKGSIPHWDDHDVFVLQVLDRKKWQLETQHRALPARGEKMHRVEGREFQGDITELMFEQGDLLYVPRGWIHAAECGSEPSLHVTIGLIPHFFEDFLRAAIKTAIERDRSLRSALPSGFMQGQSDEVIDLASGAFRLMTDGEFLAQVLDRYRDELAKSRCVTCGIGVADIHSPAMAGISRGVHGARKSGGGGLN